MTKEKDFENFEKLEELNEELNDDLKNSLNDSGKKQQSLKEHQDNLKEQVEKLENDYNTLNDKYLRCLAEYDNFRKRTSKEKENIFSDALIFSIKNFLDVLDNFERALKCETKDIELKKGFEMIFNQLLDVLKKLGVEEIQTDSQSFDPSYHNAVMHIEDDQYGQNQIVETLQKGYKLGNNIIRYAMVKVAN